jgi:hypothetical protein
MMHRDFKKCVLAGALFSPSLMGTIAATYFSGPASLLHAVIGYTSAYLFSRSMTLNYHSQDVENYERLELRGEWKKINKNMRIMTDPPVFCQHIKRNTGSSNRGNIFLGIDVLQDLPQDEVDFLYAHELAHFKRGDHLPYHAGKYALGANVSLALLNAGILHSDAGAHFSTQGMACIAFGAAAAVTHIIRNIHAMHVSHNPIRRHQREFDCDRRAVLATGNIDAGIRWLQRQKEDGSKIDKDSSTHPSFSQRIAALEDLKLELELRSQKVEPKP